MQRIHDSTAASSLPSVPSLTGNVGYFTEGVPGTTPATDVRGWWLNMIQEELISLLTAAGITPDTTGTDFTQVLQAIQTLTGPGRLLNIQSFLTAGTFTYTPTSGTNSIIVEVIAAGGGSAGCPATTSGQFSAGGPGGGGSFGRKRLTSGFSGASIVVGAAGAAGAAGANGGTGGNSSFGALISTSGGLGGQTGGPGTGNVLGPAGSGGSGGTGGDINIGGNSANGSLNLQGTGVFGLATPGYLGFELSPGGGASGSVSNGAASATVGRAGEPGAVFIYEYS